TTCANRIWWPARRWRWEPSTSASTWTTPTPPRTACAAGWRRIPPARRASTAPAWRTSASPRMISARSTETISRPIGITSDKQPPQKNPAGAPSRVFLWVLPLARNAIGPVGAGNPGGGRDLLECGDLGVRLADRRGALIGAVLAVAHRMHQPGDFAALH